MRKFGRFSEQVETKFRTSGDNREVTITPPSTLAGASNTFTTPNISGTSDTIISRASVDQATNRLQNKDLSANNVGFVDSADTSKKLLLSLSGLTTATTRTLTVPDISDTIVTLTASQVLTNKTIDGDNNTVQDLALTSLKTTGNLNVFLQRNGSGVVIDSAKAVPTGDVLGTSDSQILTNKTIDADLNSLSNIDNNDIKTAAGIVYSKLSLADSIVNADINSAAAIAYSKLNLSGSIVNADVNASAAIAYSKLNLSASIVNADINNSAAIAVSKLAALTAGRAVITDGSGYLTTTSTTATEIGYVSGVTSAIQTQLNAKQADVITTRGDVIVGNASNIASRLALGANGTVLTSNGTDAIWSTPAGTGDVTSAANIGDNRLVRGDGGAKGVQQTGITVDDSSNASGFANLTMNGSLINEALTTGIAHVGSGGAFTSSLIVNADVDAAAAIAGTKISPNFGSQNIETSGILGLNRASLGTAQLQIDSTDNPIELRTSATGVLVATEHIASAEGARVILRHSRNTTFGNHTIVNSGDTLGQFDFSGSDGSNYIIGARITAAVDGTPGTNDMPGRIVFSTTADGASSVTERMRISSAGHLTLSSAGRMSLGADVDNDAQVLTNGRLQVSATTTPAIGVAAYRNEAGGSTLNLAHSRSSTIGNHTIVQNGDFFFSIAGWGSDGTQFREGARITANVDGTPGSADMPGRLDFYTTADGASTPSVRMRIKNDGTVRIGDADATSSPNTHLWSKSASGNIPYSGYRPTSTATSYLSALYSDVGGTEILKWRVEADGDTISSTGSYTSDARIKKNIEQLTPGLSEVLQLNPIAFHFNHEQDSEVKNYGFLAQEIEQVLPELVRNDGLGYVVDNQMITTKAVYYNELIPILVKSIQQLTARVQELENAQ